MKKLLLTLGSVAAIVAPVASVVACSSDTDKKVVVTNVETPDTSSVPTNLKKVIEGGVTYYKAPDINIDLRTATVAQAKAAVNTHDTYYKIKSVTYNFNITSKDGTLFPYTYHLTSEKDSGGENYEMAIPPMFMDGDWEAQWVAVLQLSKK